MKFRLKTKQKSSSTELYEEEKKNNFCPIALVNCFTFKFLIYVPRLVEVRFVNILRTEIENTTNISFL